MRQYQQINTINKLNHYIIIIMVLFVSYNSKSNELEDGYYYFLDETQISSCHQSSFSVFCLSNPNLKEEINLVVIGNRYNNINYLRKHYKNNIILDSFNLIAAKYGIKWVPSLLKIKNSQIDTNFKLDYVDTFGELSRFDVKTNPKLTEMYNIKKFLKSNEYYVFYDDHFGNIIFYNFLKDEIQNFNLTDFYTDYFKNFTQPEMKEMFEFAKFGVDIKNLFSKNDKITAVVEMVDSVRVTKSKSEGTHISAIDNLYEIEFELNNELNFTIKESDSMYIDFGIIPINDEKFNYKNSEYKYENFYFKMDNISNFSLNVLEYDNKKIVFSQKVREGNSEVLASNSTLLLSFYKDNNFIGSNNFILPYKLNNCEKVIPVHFDGEKIKYFLYHNIEGWIEIDQYLDFDFLKITY